MQQLKKRDSAQLQMRGICSKVDVLGSRCLKASLKRSGGELDKLLDVKARERYVEFESESIEKLLWIRIQFRVQTLVCLHWVAKYTA